MSRPRIVLFALLYSLMVAPAVAQNTPKKQTDTFVFLHIADVFQGRSASEGKLAALANDPGSQGFRPSFVVGSGNLTQNADTKKFQDVQAAVSGWKGAGVGFYGVPGPSDVKRSDEGKGRFEREIGKPYQSFDYGGAHFLLLDSTVLFSSWGHLDKAQIDFAVRDLKKVRQETPVFVFLSHPVGQETPGVRPLDNEYEFWPLLYDHNVIAVFTGARQQNLTTQPYNETRVLSTPGLANGFYHRILVTPAQITIEKVSTDAPTKAEQVAQIPVKTKTRASQMRSGWDDPDIPFLYRRRPAATLRPRGFDDTSDNENALFRVDDGNWLPMSKDMRDIWRGLFYTKDVSIGIHTATVRLTTATNRKYQNELIFEVERGFDEPTRRWAFNCDGPIQSSPKLYKDLLIVTSLDGKIYGLNTDKGRRKWTVGTKGPILASPALDRDIVYIGSTDKSVSAIQAETGKVKWRVDVDGPVFATAAVAQNIVCVGTANMVRGLDAETGKERWKTPINGSVAGITTDNDSFYLGGSGKTLYALDARSGNLRWQESLTNAANINSGPADGTLWTAPAVVGNTVVVSTEDGWLHARNLRTGENVWAVQAPAGGDAFGQNAPVAAGSTLLVSGTGERGTVYALRASDGKILWRTATEQPIYASTPRLSDNGTFAIMGVRGKVSVLNATDGKKLWSYELGPGNILSSPEYDGNVVYTVTMANDVQALNKPGFGTLRQRPLPKTGI